MNVDIKGVHFDIGSRTREYVDKKLRRLAYAENLLVDLLLTVTKEKKGYQLDANLNFRWGYSTHIGDHSFDLFAGIDKFFDTIEAKVSKEKSKIQEKKGVSGVEDSIA